jgi:hypothetical protein
MIRHFSRLGAKVFTVGAVMALAALIAAPANAATAGPLGNLEINGSTSGTSDVTLTNKGSVSATFGGITFPCSSASGSGTAFAGAPVPNPYMVLDSVSILGCAGPLGLTMTITQNCDLTVSADLPQTVHDDLSDHAVAGKLHVGPVSGPCLHAHGSNFFLTCDLDVYGDTTATFDEDNTDNDDQQELTISGNTLKIINSSGDCAGIDNSPIQLNVTFHVASDPSTLNFVPDCTGDPDPCEDE